MIFNWRDYLRLAEDLCKQDTEAHYRTAISKFIEKNPINILNIDRIFNLNNGKRKIANF